MLNLQAANAFERQLGRGFWRMVIGWIAHRCHKLLTFSDTVKQTGFAGQHDLGVQTVPVEQIVGTLGRVDDFDDEFRPRHNEDRERWTRVYRAFSEGKALPAVELYKVGDQYFVEDGHHRISVGRANGQTYIDAHVIEVVTDHQPHAV